MVLGKKFWSGLQKIIKNNFHYVIKINLLIFHLTLNYKD
jgi:hypothetical protein